MVFPNLRISETWGKCVNRFFNKDVQMKISMQRYVQNDQLPVDGEVKIKIIKKHYNTPIRKKGLISTEHMSNICSIYCAEAEETEIPTSTIITHTDPPRRMPIYNFSPSFSGEEVKKMHSSTSTVRMVATSL